MAKRRPAGQPDAMSAARKKAAHIYRPDIDGLRALAVLSVIAFHAKASLLPGGFIGVDIFFVISGYLISGIIFENLAAGSFTFRDFYARRIRRIFPALITILLTTLIAGWFLLLADEYANLGKNIVAGAGFFSNFVLWRESGYFDAAAKFKPLLHLWSLGIEEQFYIVWPALLYACHRRKWNIFYITAGIAIISHAINVVFITDHAAAIYYLPASRLWELMTGSLLACTEQKPKASPRFPQLDPNIRAALGLALLLAAFLTIDENTPYPGWHGLLPVLGTVFLISAGPHAVINRTIFAQRACVAIGLISYPLYLWHWPLLSFAWIYGMGAPSPGLTVTAVALSFLLAWLTYTVIEKPSRVAFAKNRKRTIGVLIGLMIATAIGGGIVWHWKGLPSRFPEAAAYEAFGNSEKALNWQRDRCFLLPESPVDAPEAFDKYHCSGAQPNGKPLILLVGDSHAAALYAGLAATFASKANIGQLTSGFCLPMLETMKIMNSKAATARCNKINAYVFAAIRRLKPDVLLVTGNFSAYEYDKLWSYPGYLAAIQDHVDRLAQSGIKNIIIVGQTPTWQFPLPKIAERMLIDGKPVPERLNALVPEAKDADRVMQAHAWAKGVTYISLIDGLCDAGWCRATVGPDLPNDLAFIDTGHLSDTGSRYVMEKLVGPVIAQKLQ